MSDVGFKRNSPTESLNGWYKDIFFKDYRNSFDSLESFKIKFKEFILKRNNLQDYIYNKKREHLQLI
ncbi:hypothetical protein [Spiroplasma endosymbiont of Dioctria linearis]|uniref:hypothetical protein n=1 Tax=Spiroplasma endosymbiont of Dioctria linearis TaxID=3066290 RepID=UPI00313B1A7C